MLNPENISNQASNYASVYQINQHIVITDCDAMTKNNIPEYAPRPFEERLHETKASYPSAMMTSADRSCLDNLVSYNTAGIDAVTSNKSVLHRKPNTTSLSFTLCIR